MLLNQDQVASQAQQIFNEFTGSEYGRRTIEAAKNNWPEYKTEPGYDTTEEAVEYVFNAIENNHSFDLDHLADPLYEPHHKVSVNDFQQVDETGGSVKYYLHNLLTDLFLGE